MELSTFHFPLSTLANQLPDLPAGPSLENVRGPIEASGFNTTQVVIAAAAVVLIAGALFWLYLRSRQKTTEPVDPKEIALSELKAAESALDDERFAVTCANALRRFLEVRYGLPVTSQTSNEASRLLPLPAEQKDKIRNFLGICDGVKFAAQPLSENQRIELSDTARQFITLLGKEAPSES